jgi:hypothetical protein
MTKGARSDRALRSRTVLGPSACRARMSGAGGRLAQYGARDRAGSVMPAERALANVSNVGGPTSIQPHFATEGPMPVERFMQMVSRCARPLPQAHACLT